MDGVTLFVAFVCEFTNCHTTAILSRETKRALFYHAKPRNGNHGDEAWRGKTKLFWSPGAIWPPSDKGEWQPVLKASVKSVLKNNNCFVVYLSSPFRC